MWLGRRRCSRRAGLGNVLSCLYRAAEMPRSAAATRPFSSTLDFPKEEFEARTAPSSQAAKEGTKAKGSSKETAQGDAFGAVVWRHGVAG